MRRYYIICFLFVLCLTSCGKNVERQRGELSISPNDSKQPSETTTMSVATAMPRTAKKTVKEAFAGLWQEELIQDQQDLYFSKEYDEVRHDTLSEWKDEQGQYKCPEDYKIVGTIGDPWIEAAQQMPPKLLHEIGTEELYQLMMESPGFSSASHYDSYLLMLSYYYNSCNFLQNFMQREDCADVVHCFYNKYTKKEKKRYSKCFFEGTKSEDMSEEKVHAEIEKAGKFQLTEGLEWFCKYRKGKEIPDEKVFGLPLIEKMMP